MQTSSDIKMDLRDRLTEVSSPNSTAASYSDASFSVQRFAAAPQPTSNGSGGDRDSTGPSVSPTLPHGYAGSSVAEHEAHIHPELRSVHKQVAKNGHAPTPNMMSAGMQQPEQAGSIPGPAHMSAGAPNMGTADMGDMAMAQGRKNKRELSQSKRAAQNRAAQRAFRQRKELYIKKLEQDVRDMGEMEVNFKTIQAENYALKEYVINLQSCLIDAHGEYPQPPPNVNLALPHAPQPPVAPGSGNPTASNPAAGTGTSLEVVEQAVASLRGDHLAEGPAGGPQYANRMKSDSGEADSRSNEDITRQMPDGLP